MEVQAGMDVVALRRDYGKRLVMFGGIDKRVLRKDDAAIEAEVDRVWSIVGEGGYIPHADHSIPPDVSWENFQHYRAYMQSRTGFPG
jgi:uroporphyrinogen decarboxylase